MDCKLDKEVGREWDLEAQPGQAQGQWAQGEGADIFRWDAPQVLLSIGLKIVENEFGTAPRIWPGLRFMIRSKFKEEARLCIPLGLPQLQQHPGTSAAPLDLSLRL